MADMKAQKEAEAYVRKKLFEKEGMAFSEQKVALSRTNNEGEFKFDAVDAKKEIAINISTSSLFTVTGKEGSAKVHKIRSDMFFLFLAKVKERRVVFTEKNMYDYFAKQKKAGRVPTKIKLQYMELPPMLRQKVEDDRAKAVAEVKP